MRALLVAVLAVGCSDAVAQVVSGPGQGGTVVSFDFPQPWTTDISSQTPDANSDAVVAAIQAAGGWGDGDRFRVDFGFEVLTTTPDTPFRPFTPNSDDCDGADHVPFPLPPGGALSGETTYHCASGSDCYLLVADPPTHRLFEMWRADVNGGTFSGGCAVVWHLDHDYGPYLRGKGCSSADGAGMPISPLLATADEVKSGSVNHALRLALPGDRVQRGMYVSPASHSTGATSGGADLPPYGARFRLKASFDMTRLPNEAARTIARAMQRYGILLASGGNVALAVRGDRSTVAKWGALGVDAGTFEGIRVGDFEVMPIGERVDWLADTACHLAP